MNLVTLLSLHGAESLNPDVVSKLRVLVSLGNDNRAHVDLLIFSIFYRLKPTSLVLADAVSELEEGLAGGVLISRLWWGVPRYYRVAHCLVQVLANFCCWLVHFQSWPQRRAIRLSEVQCMNNLFLPLVFHILVHEVVNLVAWNCDNRFLTRLPAC